MAKIELRKIVPIAAKISAGKSFLLNVIYNIDFLECKAGIGTKFINIIRYNPNIDQPCFYHLKIEKDEKNYIFKKDSKYETKFGKEDIINENKNLNQKLADSPQINYEDIFYMTELNEVEFIKDKQYLLTHDLCDVPGLSEYQDTKTNENKKLVYYNDFEKIVLKGVEEFGIVYNKPQELNKNDKKQNNIKNIEKEQDDIYYEVDIEKKTYLTEVFKIIKNHIDGIIIVLSTENFYHEENFEIIAKLRKVIDKEIKNCLIILNKIDLSQSPIDDIDKCKGLFIQKFPKCKTFNLNLNTFIPLSAFKLKNELLMRKSFIHLLKYHFYNYLPIVMNEKSSEGKYFVDYLKNIIFNGENGITNEKIKEKVAELNKDKNISIINDQIKKTIRELKERYKADNINFGIEEKDFDNNEEEEDEDDDDNNNDNLKSTYIVKMIYVLYKEKKLIPPISEETNKLLNYFTVKNPNNNKANYKANENDNSEINKLNEELINEFESFAKEIKDSKMEDEKIKNLINEIIEFIEFLKIYNVIFIPFLGPSNAGKSTIINGLIGKDILPTKLNECTKRGILIKYSNSDDICIYKSNFIEQEDIFGKINYYFHSKLSKDLIGKGEEAVKNTLNSLNCDYNEKEKDSFYYIKTRIKLFDDMGLNDSLKNMIYFIDFPGFGTGGRNIFENKNIYKKVMSICNSFIFVVRNSVIKENTCQSKLKEIFDLAKEGKKKFFSQFIKSCLFILNNDIDQSCSESDLNKTKSEIKYMLNFKKLENGNETEPTENSDDIKLCFFNAKYYDNYCCNYNYFYDLDNLFKSELNNYKKNLFCLYENPFSFRKSKNDNEFFDYFYNNIMQKIKNLYGIKNLKKKLIDQEINSNMEEKMKNKIIEINKNENLNLGDKELSEIKEKLLKIITFGQNKLSELETLKESNIENFKVVLQSQINYINEIKLKNLEKINDVIDLLDMFFRKDFNERKKDLKEITRINKLLTEIEREINESIKLNDELIQNLKSLYKKNIKFSLFKHKEELIEKLKSKNYSIILEEINKELSYNLKGINVSIDAFINFNERQNMKLIEFIKEIIKELSLKGKKKLRIILKYDRYKLYMSKLLGNENKNFEEELIEELKNSCENSRSILFKKGIINWLNSLFSDYNYLDNIIDILIDTSSKSINSVFDLIKNESSHYFTKYLKKINLLVKSATMEFNVEQEKKWKKLCDSYEQKRKTINQIKNKIFNILGKNVEQTKDKSENLDEEEEEE